MIQRKQTVYLLLAFILTVVCMASQVGSLVGEVSTYDVYNLWVVDGDGNRSLATWPMLATLMLSALLSLVTVFLYTRRRLQAQLCMLVMLLLVLWYVLLAVLPSSSVGGSLVVEWPAVLPAVAIILSFMARKGVISDEKLVRSLDRIR